MDLVYSRINSNHKFSEFIIINDTVSIDIKILENIVNTNIVLF